MGERARVVKRRRFIIDDPVYNAEILCYVGFTYVQTRRAIERMGEKKGITFEWEEDDLEYYAECDGAYLKLEASDGDTLRVIWIEKYEHGIDGVVLLSHETEHAAYEIMLDRNVEYSEESEEAFIRYHNYLLKICLTKLWDA